MDVLENFKKELQSDTQIDEINLTQKQLMLPAIKHKWVARLIDQKRKFNTLNKKKKIIRAAVVASLEKEGMPPGLPKSALDKKIENSDAIQKINEEIEDTEIIIEYLEKIETIFRTMTYDIKNIIDINRLETT
jgi:Recombination, repair and ssDNA binding protein UvsY